MSAVERVREMSLPHRCGNCGKVYDGAGVTVTARYADCDVWHAPCCGAIHDSRVRWGGPNWARMGYTDLRALLRAEGEFWFSQEIKAASGVHQEQPS